MEVFVRNVPEQINENSFRNSLRSAFTSLSIVNVHCQKVIGRRFATLTFLNIDEGQQFLARHGQVRSVDRRAQLPKQRAEILKVHGQPIYFELSSREADRHLLRVLAKEADDRIKHQYPSKSLVVSTHVSHADQLLPFKFDCSSVACGVWTTDNSEIVFAPQVEWNGAATAVFGKRIMKLLISPDLRIDFRYTSVLEITTEDARSPSITFTMIEAPRFFQRIETDPVAELMTQLNITAQGQKAPSVRKSRQDRKRIPYLNKQHKDLAGSCLVYRISLNPYQITEKGDLLDFGNMMESFGKIHGMPPVLHQSARVCGSLEPYAIGFKKLHEVLSSISSQLPFALKFQIQRLAHDGYLSPSMIMSLLPSFEGIDATVAVNVIRKFARKIPHFQPDTDASEFSLARLMDLLEECESQAKKEAESGYEQAIKSQNVANIHRARVTPSGVRLHGPEPESNNRVLRRYSKHHEFFLRVQFCDEDGQPIRFSSRISNDPIFYGRFLDVLKNGIVIGERTYTYLGFSHSSLRAQSCWFMAPFVFEGRLQIYQNTITGLGDFAQIRSPAKCAARIGQAFSDTRTAVRINMDSYIEIPDVERNNRVFSDGWAELPKKNRLNPTCLQIRFLGAKGMISLDTRLSGEVLALRRSMIKFDAPESFSDIEICEGAIKPLPMYLNRQFIKILEDMGVEKSFFLNLQAAEVSRLRMVADDPLNASKFLTRQSIGETVHLPWLITELAMLNLDFRSDGFLRDTVELALLGELRKLKYKTRIPVPKGYHLHGLMDETGFLEEGQIYCAVIVDGVVKHIVAKNIIVSRAPALHPGDCTIVEGVMPPAGSPLLALHNCICFSQKGSRDIPSQLSGGDLDGDRYYIMWDEMARPKRIFRPADYPRVPPLDIGRSVTRDDMCEFFVKFMESDQLGRIAVAHRVKADQEELGVLHHACLKMAEMHSTAVDFSKTGIPVDMSQFPRMVKWRPDFEAPGPHVRIEPKGLSLEEKSFREPLEEEDEDDEFSSYRYYRSEKVLGKLFRAIDEREIFREIQERASAEGIARRSGLMESVWKHVESRVKGIQWEYLMNEASDIREMYEDCVYEIMTEYSSHPSRPLSELEVFTGNILGKAGAPTRQQRELSKTMKEKFEDDTAFIVNCITKDGNEYANSEEALAKSIACLAVSLEATNPYKRSVQLSSFKYVAAAVCLREVNKLPGWSKMPTLDVFDDMRRLRG
ncbi:hypothetical protein HYALB_00005534 [Hymenoscyphus albidus]|uniref:RNA-dependent RNA polymerase n=1 Tax=Hymenoscyphus albidus TaxID=595503 RepID=A0A9N9Q8I0_9HELO|nr:hypothetical protein HYALB_00005534 [Hymenoscyphus albidus]